MPRPFCQFHNWQISTVQLTLVDAFKLSRWIKIWKPHFCVVLNLNPWPSAVPPTGCILRPKGWFEVTLLRSICFVICVKMKQEIKSLAYSDSYWLSYHLMCNHKIQFPLCFKLVLHSDCKTNYYQHASAYVQYTAALNQICCCPKGPIKMVVGGKAQPNTLNQ